MSSKLVHVARDGRVLGQYTPTQVATFSESGHFLPTDFVFSDELREWLPLDEFIIRAAPPRFQRAKQDTTTTAAERERAARRASRRPANGAAIGAFIAFLLTFAALLGAIFWVATLYSQLEVARGDVDKARLEKEAAEKEYQRMMFVSREMAAPGTVRGTVILRNSGGKRVAIPGLSVQLFTRQAIEEFLDSRFKVAPSGGLQAGEIPAFLTEGLPAPASATTTDASGRFDFNVPDPGEYVLVATVGGDGQAIPDRVWFVSFDSRDPVNTLVELTDMNPVQQLVRSLVVIDGR